MTFAAWADEWRKTTVHLRPSTRALYASDVKPHLEPHFGAMPLAKITPVEVRSWLSNLAAGSLSSATVNRQYRLLRRILAVAVESDMLVKSPCAGVKPPGARQVEMRLLSPDEVDALADAITPRYRALVLLPAYSGLRWGELVGLRRKDVNLLRRSVTVVQQLTEVEGRLEYGPPKTSRRRVTLPAFLVPVLDEQLAEHAQAGADGLAFTTSTGGAPSPEQLAHEPLAAGDAASGARRLAGARPPAHRSRTGDRCRCARASNPRAHGPLLADAHARALRASA
jgi:integrase